MRKVLRVLLALVGVCMALMSARAFADDDDTRAPVANGNLLFQKKPLRSDARRRVEALTDGRRGREGDS